MPDDVPPNDPARQLADYRQQFGPDAGNLALALDQLTDVLRLVGQHTTYCHAQAGARGAEPPPDLLDLHKLVESTKALVQETLLRLKAA